MSTPAQPAQPAQEEPHSDHQGDHGTLENLRCCVTSLTPFTVQKDSEDEGNVWKMYLDEVEADDNRLTDTWKQDAKGVLVFVSQVPNYRSSRSCLNDKPQDWSFLRNR
jgi:hypothetical protein